MICFHLNLITKENATWRPNSHNIEDMYISSRSFATGIEHDELRAFLALNGDLSCYSGGASAFKAGELTKYKKELAAHKFFLANIPEKLCLVTLISDQKSEEFNTAKEYALFTTKETWQNEDEKKEVRWYFWMEEANGLSFLEELKKAEYQDHGAFIHNNNCAWID